LAVRARPIKRHWATFLALQELIMNLLLFFGGLILLVIGADILVRGASKLAMSFGISPLVVGLTIVAFGTSAPEVAVSVGAILDGKTDIAIGNVVGSNIFNVLFILGISALITPLVVNIQLIRQEVPIMLGASLLLLALSLDGRLSFLDGGFLFALLLAYTVFLVVQSRRETQAAKDEFSEEIKPAHTGRLGQPLGGADRIDRCGSGGTGVRLGLPGAGLGELCQGHGCERPRHWPDHRRRRNQHA
jgi:Ca2+/Na+ antiporter